MTEKIHRQIYKFYHETILVDEHGKTYDIHHIDGDHSNNHIFNLIAVTIQDHFDIHWHQGDYDACRLIALKMRRSSKEISKLAKLAAKKRVDEGTHPWLDGETARKRELKKVENGTHVFLGGEIQRNLTKRLIENGTHNFLGDKNPVHKKVANRTHHTFGPTMNELNLANGKHCSQIKKTCPVCEKTMGVNNYVRYGHGKDCDQSLGQS